jgi:succinyl-CoA synthetase beta subunit
MVAMLTTTCVVNRKMLRRYSFTAVPGTAAETGCGVGGDEAAVILSAIIDALCSRENNVSDGLAMFVTTISHCNVCHSPVMGATKKALLEVFYGLFPSNVTVIIRVCGNKNQDTEKRS